MIALFIAFCVYEVYKCSHVHLISLSLSLSLRRTQIKFQDLAPLMETEVIGQGDNVFSMPEASMILQFFGDIDVDANGYACWCSVQCSVKSVCTFTRTLIYSRAHAYSLTNTHTYTHTQTNSWLSIEEFMHTAMRYVREQDKGRKKKKRKGKGKKKGKKTKKK
jgi:hypothetical protein